MLGLMKPGAVAITPSTASHLARMPHSTAPHKARNLIEIMFCHLKDFQGIATRFDKHEDIVHSAICLAAEVSCPT